MNCLECQDLLQRRLDGDNLQDNLPFEQQRRLVGETGNHVRLAWIHLDHLIKLDAVQFVGAPQRAAQRLGHRDRR